MTSKKKFIFIVQGEGRGHMTQAISMRELLVDAGHEVSCVLVGKSVRRSIPDFFIEKIKTKVITFESPNFVTDKKNKSIKLLPTITSNLFKLNTYLRNIDLIKKTIKAESPDIIVNFYDLLAGLYMGMQKPKNIKYICVGHQYLMLDHHFIFPKGKLIEKGLVKLNTLVTSMRSDKRLGLSFKPMNLMMDFDIKVVPPLLRKEVLNQNTSEEDFILAYVVNDGYAEELVAWHHKNSQIKIHCFWDCKTYGDNYQPHPNLTFHQLNDILFLEMMSKCKGFITTAGFESICEAMYLGKPVMMVPIEGQYEQECNAIDGTLSGAGIYDKEFNVSKLLEFIPKYQAQKQSFSHWVNYSKEIFIKELAS